MHFFLRVCFLFQILGTCAQAIAVCPSCHNEWEILDVVAELLPKNPVVIQGGYSENATLKMCYLWPNGQIYIFEANPKHFQMLRTEPYLGYLRAEIFPYALDETTGRAAFYISDTPLNPWVGSLLPAAQQWKWYYTDHTEIVVECKNLQEWANEKGLQAVDFLWLNIGGAEGRVLKSSPRLVKTAKVVLVETHEQEFRRGIGFFEEVKMLLEQDDLELIHQWKVPNYQGYSLFMKRGLAEIKR